MLAYKDSRRLGAAVKGWPSERYANVLRRAETKATKPSTHQVRSTYEMRVDNWLADHGLDHEVEPRMPFTSNWRADFRVGDTFIEVWGVSGKPAYDEKKAAKIAAFRRHRAKLIELPHWIFAAKHDSALERRLAQLLCKPDVT